MKLIRQKLFSMIDPSVVSRFLGVLGGFIFKAKVLHWAAKGKDIHEYLDAFWKLLYDFQDTIAEGWMGIGGKFSASDIGFVVSEPNEPREFLREVEEKVLDFYELLPDDPRFKGLSGEVEGFIQEIQKYKYLFSLCYDNEAREEKEFSEKKEDSKKKAKSATVIGGSTAAFLGGRHLSIKGKNLHNEAINAKIKGRSLLTDLRTNETVAGKLFEKANNAGTVEKSDEFWTSAIKKRRAANIDSASAEKFIRESGEKAAKSKIAKNAGKALKIAAIAAPAAYFGAKAIKKAKDKKKSENK